MVVRRPLVLASGLLSELPPGDTTVGASVGTLTAGSGLSGGGDLSSNQRVDVSLAPNPSGVIFVGGGLGLDGAAQRTADIALSSGNVALAIAIPAQASGNAALSRAGGTMTGPIIFAAGQQINTAANISGGVSGAVAYQSAPSTTAFLSPGASGQVLTTAGSNTPPVWATPAGGKILQAVQSTHTGTFVSTSSTSYVVTPLFLSITPSSTSSRILITSTFSDGRTSGSLTNFTIFRNGVNLAISASIGGFSFSGGTYSGSSPYCINFIDSPATTSSTTYQLYFKSSNGTTVYFNYDSYFSGNYGLATLTALEIGP